MSGHLECITGPMFSGKSEELIRRLRRVEIAKQNSVVFKPIIDNRYSVTEIASHAGSKREAYAVADSLEVLDIVNAGWYEVVAIDEVQFFDPGIVNLIEELIKDKRVIASGLDMDFRKGPFGFMPELLAIAKEVLKLHSVCQVCGEDAMYTQRLVDGEPAPLSGETVKIGGQDQYQARCENCWEAG